MRTLAGILVGVTFMILWHTLGWPWLAWVFTRIPPATHPDCKPRYREWHHGVEVDDGWLPHPQIHHHTRQGTGQSQAA